MMMMDDDMMMVTAVYHQPQDADDHYIIKQHFIVGNREIKQAQKLVLCAERFVTIMRTDRLRRNGQNVCE